MLRWVPLCQAGESYRYLPGTRPNSRLNFLVCQVKSIREDIERQFLLARHASDIEVEENFGKDGLDDSGRHETTWTRAGAVSEA